MTEIDASTQLFSQAAVLLMVGMAFVFVFLSLLIVIIKWFISPLGNRFPDPLSPVKSIGNKKSPDANNETARIAAAISVAINQYRKKNL